MNNKKITCNPCNYEYEPSPLSPSNGLKPGVDFKDIPDDWVCSVCNQSKLFFVPLNQEKAALTSDKANRSNNNNDQFHLRAL